jgi:hypothetical protein
MPADGVELAAVAARAPASGQVAARVMGLARALVPAMRG